MTSLDDDDAPMSAQVAALRPAVDVVQREMFAQLASALFDTRPAPVTLGRYTLLSRRGAGGMGTVFAAWDHRLQRRVALKVLHRGHGRDRQDEILREARALASVVDPHVVAVFDAGRDDDDAWIAMEYVEGVEIGVALRRDVVSTSQLARWLGEAAAGIATAHRSGVVHGDIKPSNVLVGGDGRVRVVDFGMATVVGDARMRGGTIGYLAPELVGTGRGAPSLAGDVFAFCVTADELHHALGWGAWPRRLTRMLRRGRDPSPAARPSMTEIAVACRAVAHRPRDRTISAIVLGTGVVLLAATWIGRTEQRCALALAPSWHEGLRSRAQTALVADGALGERVWSSVAPALDAQAETWIIARDAACASQGPTREAMMSCLDARDYAMVALVEALERKGSPPRIDRILAAAGDAKDCETDESAIGIDDRELRQGLVRVQVSKILNDFPRALEDAEQLWSAAKRQGGGNASRAALELGELRALAGNALGARELLATAYFDAIENRDDALAIDAAIMSMRVVSMSLGDVEGGARWERPLLAALARADPPRYTRVRAVDTLARLAQRQDDWKKARALAESVLFADDAAAADPPIARVRLGMLYAGILRHEGDVEGQLAQLVLVLEVATATYVPDHPDIGLAHIALGSALDDLGRYDEAIVSLEQGIAILERAEIFDRLGDPHYLAGRALMNAGRLAEARAHFERSREIIATYRGPTHAEGVLPLIGLAEVASTEGDLIAARASYEQALAIAAPRSGDRAHVEFAIADLDRKEGKWDAALQGYRAARQTFADPATWRVMLAETWVGEARALVGRGDHALARAAFAEARALAARDPPLPEFITAIDEMLAAIDG